MEQDIKKINILGSTGSIGTQTLDVIRSHPELFRVTALSCGRNTELLREQIREFSPEAVCCLSKDDAEKLRSEFPGLKVMYGAPGLIEISEYDCDIFMNSLSGMRGLVPTYHAISKGRNIALANKETLVAGGSVVMKAVRDMGVRMLPVDSEHSAIFQCLMGNAGKKIRRILLTCSGGPFRKMAPEAMESVTPEMALKHPNWSMGRKITIDSATLMNKGLEIIEAKWLFDTPVEDIEVLVHPESIMHSGVEFEDRSVLAQLGTPDMRIPISVALGYPDRLSLPLEPLDFFGKGSSLTFERPDEERFPCLAIAKEAGKTGGLCPAAMNAANEVLVEAFLSKEIGFMDIPRGVSRIMEGNIPPGEPELLDIIELDREVRERVEKDILCRR